MAGSDAAPATSKMRVVFPDDWNGAFEAAPEIARLRRRAEVSIYRIRPANLAHAISDADVAVALRERTRYDAGLLEAMPRLKMIGVMRRFGQQDRAIRAGEWPGPVGRVLSGKTLGILGLGRLGGELAGVARLLGMRVLAAGLTLTPERAAAARVEFRSIEDLFAESDVVSIHLRLSDS